MGEDVQESRGEVSHTPGISRREGQPRIGEAVRTGGAAWTGDAVQTVENPEFLPLRRLRSWVRREEEALNGGVESTEGR